MTRSATNWFRGSHLRLLVAGLVAVGMIGAVSIFAAGSHQIKVTLHSNVDPKTIPVSVTAFGGLCRSPASYTGNPVYQNTGQKGEAIFSCEAGKKHSVSVPKQVKASDGKDCVADNGTQRDIGALNGDWNPTFHYTCTGSAAPGGGSDDGGTGIGNQNDDKAQVKVWVNPRPAADGQPVSISGAGCDASSKVNSNNANGGAIIFGGCTVDKEVTVKVPKTFQTEDKWDYQVGNVNDQTEVRKIKVGKKDDANVISYYFYGGQTASPVKQTAQIKVVVKPIDKTPGKLNITIRGGHCNGVDGKPVYTQAKPVGKDGTVTFDNCDVGAGYKVTIDKPSFTDASGTWIGGPLVMKERYLAHLDKKAQGDNEASWQPTYEFTQQAVAAQAKGSLIVKSFNDLNCNKVQDAGEATLPNAPYSYAGPNNAKADLNTGPAGANTTPDLDPGAYTVKTTAPGGFKACSNTDQQVTVQTGQAATVTFGYQAIPTPAGKGNVVAMVYNDKNGNGSRDADESGIAGANVTAKVKASSDTDADGVSLKTNDSGQVTFSNLPNAQYSVSAEPNQGFVSVSPAIQDVTLQDNTKTLTFGQQQVSKSDDGDGNGDSGGNGNSEDNVSGPNNAPSGSTGPAESLVKGFNSLPKTGQAGLILLLTVLAASGTYYGGRKFLAKRHGK